jgi:hypothetical protein
MPPAAPNPVLPIAIGFYLLSLPLWIGALRSPDARGAIANASAGALFVLAGLLIHRRGR